jgi:hypothetical protein
VEKSLTAPSFPHGLPGARRWFEAHFSAAPAPSCGG